MEIYILYIDYISVACPEASRHGYTSLGTQTMCPNERNTGAKQHQIFNHIFNVNVSTPSQTFNLSISLKIIELKTLCMPVSACLFKCITKYCCCVNKSRLYIVLACPNLTLDTAQKIFLLFTIIYSKININVVKTYLPWQ